MGEGRRETEKEREKEIERERRGRETDVPKLCPTMNMNSLCVEVGALEAKFAIFLFLFSPISSFHSLSITIHIFLFWLSKEF